MFRTLTQQVTAGALIFFIMTLGALIVIITSLSNISHSSEHLSGHVQQETDANGHFTTALTRAILEAEVFVHTGDELHLTESREALSEAQAALAELDGWAHEEAEHAFDTGHTDEHGPLPQRRADLLAAVGGLLNRLETTSDVPTAQVQDEIAQFTEMLHHLEEDTDQHLEHTTTVVASAVTQAVRSSIYSIGIALGLLLLMLVVALVLLARRIVAPVKALAAATSTLAQNKSDLAIQVTSDDEIGELQRSFNEMAVMIRQQTRALEQQVAAAHAARLEAEEQRAIIRDISVPILPLSKSTLILPLVGALDTARIQLLQERVLQTIAQTSARYLLLDITGVPVVDTQVAHGVLRTVQAARLLGTQVVIVGIRADVAQAIVGLGVQLGDIITYRTLESGIAYTLALDMPPGMRST